jgi:hypothetical protein
MPSSDRIKEAMETLLKIFKEDNLEKVARAVFRGSDIPADKWSFLIRVLMYLNETDDARGFRQWQQVGRYVFTVCISSSYSVSGSSPVKL